MGVIRKGKAVGFHYEGIEGSRGEIREISNGPNQYGIYESEYTIIDGRLKGYSSFFPRHYTPQQVIDVIYEAFNNKVLLDDERPLYEGYTSAGFTIKMYIKKDPITKKKLITSAFPVYIPD